MIAGLASSTRTLFWGSSLMFIIFYVCAVFLTRVFGKDSRYSQNEDLQRRFGTLFQSMFSCFMLLTMEGWPDIAEPVMKEQPAMWIFFVGFIGFTSCACLNLLMAVICDNIMTVARHEERDAAELAEEERCDALEDLRRKLVALDFKGTGALSFEDFALAVRDPGVVSSLRGLRVDSREIGDILELITLDETSDVSIDEFLYCCKHANRCMTARDILSIKYEFIALSRSMYSRFGDLERKLLDGCDASSSESEDSKNVGAHDDS